MSWLGTADTWPWMRACTGSLLETVDALDEADLDAPSGLSDWSRRHLVAHVGLNAEALRRLVRWAASGEPHPMYASTEQRNADIAAGATWPTDRLRALVHDGAAALDADLVALPADRWTAQIRTAQGRAVPASEIVWMRVREVAVHAVDLDTGTGFGDLPLPLCRALVADVAARRSGQGDGPALELTGTDGGSWTVTGAGAPVGVAGAAAELASWLTGRGAGGLSGVDGGPLPELGAWL